MTARRLIPCIMVMALICAMLSLCPAPLWAAAGQTAAPARKDPEPQKAGPPAQKAEPAPQQPDYSQEPFVFEQFHTRVRYESDGTGRREQTIRVKVQSEAGVQQLGQLVFGYSSANERVEIGYVRVRKADGSVVTAQPDAVQDLSAPIAREAPVYTDFRQKHITVPGLRPGETLEYQITHVLHTALAPGHFWLEYDFIEGVIVLDELLEVSVPRERTLKLKTKPGAEPAVSEEGTRRIYRWKHANLKREEEDEDNPAAKKKKRRRKPEPPAVQLTTFQSWEEVGRWYAGLEQERVLPSDAIRTKAAELVRGRASDQDKIEALYDFVARDFRYVSLSFGVGRYQPHAADEVLANQYGDCKDKHTLLASLLAATGLRAYPVLINSSRKIDPEVPAPSQFDHVISAIPLSGELLWMDTTTEVAPFRLLSSSLRSKQALLVPGDGAPRLVETPADPPFPALQEVEIEGRITDLGKLSAKVRYTLRGDNELLLRMAFRRTPKSQWKMLGQVVAASDGLRGEVSEVLASDPGATQEPFRLEYQVSQANFLDWSSRKIQMGMPLPVMGLPQAGAEDEEDGEPLDLGALLEVTTRLSLELPARYTARSPVPVSVARDYARYRSSYKIEGNTLNAERTLRFLLRELPAARTRDYLAFARAVRADEGQTLSLESSAAGTPEIPATAKAEELVQAAGAAVGNENYSLAVDLLKRALDAEPKHRSAWGTLGFAYLAQQKYEPAIEAYRKQAEINPFDDAAYHMMGLTFWRQQKFAEAAAAFRKQLEVNPLHRPAQSSLGQMLVEWRKYEEAVPELEKSISLAPNDSNLQVSLGRAYLNLNQAEKALAAFDKGVELAPEPQVWNNVAYYLSLSRVRLDRAQQYAESAVAAAAADLRNLQLDRLTTRDLARVSSLAAYWDTLGWVHFQKGDAALAERFVRASWLLDFHGEVGDHLAQIYEKQGRKQEALRAYALALAASRPDPDTRARLAKLAGGEDKVEPLLARARAELVGLRTIPLGKAPAEQKEKLEAEFYVVLVPSGARAAVEEVKFIRGSEQLRPLAAALRAAKFSPAFPDETPTKIVRRGTLACPPRGECAFVVQAADTVTSVN